MLLPSGHLIPQKLIKPILKFKLIKPMKHINRIKPIKLMKPIMLIRIIVDNCKLIRLEALMTKATSAISTVYL